MMTLLIAVIFGAVGGIIGHYITEEIESRRYNKMIKEMITKEAMLAEQKDFLRPPLT